MVCGCLGGDFAQNRVRPSPESDPKSGPGGQALSEAQAQATLPARDGGRTASTSGRSLTPNQSGQHRGRGPTSRHEASQLAPAGSSGTTLSSSQPGSGSFGHLLSLQLGQTGCVQLTPAAVDKVAGYLVSHFIHKGILYRQLFEQAASKTFPPVLEGSQFAQILSACDIHVPADKLAVVIGHYNAGLNNSNGQELAGVIPAVPAPAGGSRRASAGSSSPAAPSPSARTVNGAGGAGTQSSRGDAQSPASSQNTTSSMQMNAARLLRDLDRAAMKKFAVSKDGSAAAAGLAQVSEAERRHIITLVMDMLLSDPDFESYTWNDEEQEQVEDMIEGLDFTTLSVPTGIKARYVEAYMGASRDRPAPSGSSGVQLSAPSTLQQLQRAANAAAAAGKERAAFHVPAWSLRAMHARLDERLAAAKIVEAGKMEAHDAELKRVLIKKSVLQQQEILAHSVYSAVKAVLLQDVVHAPVEQPVVQQAASSPSLVTMSSGIPGVIPTVDGRASIGSATSALVHRPSTSQYNRTLNSAGGPRRLKQQNSDKFSRFGSMRRVGSAQMVVSGTEVEDIGSPPRPESRLAARQDSKAQQGGQQQQQQGGRALDRTTSTQESHSHYWQDPRSSPQLPGSPTPSSPQGEPHRQQQQQPQQPQSPPQPQYMGLSSLQQHPQQQQQTHWGQQPQQSSIQSHPLQPGYRQDSGSAGASAQSGRAAGSTGEVGGSAPLPKFRQRSSMDAAASSRSSGEGRVSASTILNRTKAAPADGAKQLLAHNGHTREVPEIQAC